MQQSSIRNGLLAILSEQDWAHLSPYLQAVKLPFGQTVLAAGGPVDAVLFIEAGMLSMLVTLEDGSQVEAGITGPEGMVGLPLIFGDDHSITDSRVQLGGTALRIGAAELFAAMNASPTLRGLLLRYAQAFLAQVTQTAACNARHPIENRLGRWLLIAHDCAEMDDFAMTQEFMAIMLGVNRPGVTIAARMLSQAGLIRYARGRMTITDRPGLEAAACECYRMVRQEYARLLGPRSALKLACPN